MKLFSTTVSLVLLASTGSAEAANFAVISSPPTILNLAVLLLGLAGAVIGMQLLSVVRGGFLFRAWQIFVAGFVVLILAQIAVLLSTFEIASLPTWVAPSLMVLWAGIFLYGIFETKRVLA